MGHITNVNFPDGVELNGTKIRPGMTTQVRWDLGIGTINVDGQGKIKPDIWHCHPLCGKEEEAFKKDLLVWTGVIATNMGGLFFKEGQLVHLDLSYENVGDYFLNNIFPDWQGAILDGQVQKIMSPEKWAMMEEELTNYRVQLTECVVIGNALRGFKDAIEAYAKRSGELIDPHWEEPLKMVPLKNQKGYAPELSDYLSGCRSEVLLNSGKEVTEDLTYFNRKTLLERAFVYGEKVEGIPNPPVDMYAYLDGVIKADLENIISEVAKKFPSLATVNKEELTKILLLRGKPLDLMTVYGASEPKFQLPQLVVCLEHGQLFSGMVITETQRQACNRLVKRMSNGPIKKIESRRWVTVS